MLFVACWVIPKELGALIVALGMLTGQHPTKSGWMMFTALGMKRVLRNVVMADGEVTIAITGKTSEWSASLLHRQLQVEHMHEHTPENNMSLEDTEILTTDLRWYERGIYSYLLH